MSGRTKILMMLAVSLSLIYFGLLPERTPSTTDTPAASGDVETPQEVKAPQEVEDPQEHEVARVSVGTGEGAHNLEAIVEPPSGPAKEARMPEKPLKLAADYQCEKGPDGQTAIDPLPRIGTLKGAQLNHTPAGIKPPWQLFFGEDYVAVQGVASWSEDGLLAICSGTDELILVDAEDPKQAQVVHSLRPSSEMAVLEPKKGEAYSVLVSPFGNADASNKYGRCEHIARSGDTIYFSHREDQFRHHGYVMAYDLSTTPPSRLAYRSEKGESYSGLAASKTFLAVAAHTAGVLALNDQLKELGRYNQVKNAWDVAIRNEQVFVAAGSEGLLILDFSDPEKPNLLGRVALPGFAKKVELGSDNSVYVALGPAGFAKVSVKRPRKPKIRFIRDTPGSAVDISAQGDQVAVADWSSLRLFRDTGGNAVFLAAERTGTEMRRAMAVDFRKDVIFVGDWTGVHMFEPAVQSAAPHGAFDRVAGHFMPAEAENQSKHALKVQLRNQGNGELVVYSTGTRGAAFHTDTEEFSLRPGEEKTLEMTFDAKLGGEQARGELVVCSNDPDGPEMLLPLRAKPATVGVGKMMPNLGLRMVDKQNWNLSSRLGKPVLLTYFATF